MHEKFAARLVENLCASYLTWQNAEADRKAGEELEVSEPTLKFLRDVEDHSRIKHEHIANLARLHDAA